MNRSAGRSSEWVFYLSAGFLFSAVSIRSVLIYAGTPYLGRVLGLLSLWLVLAAGELVLSWRLKHYFPIYVVCQTALVFVLLTTPGSPDFFAALLIVVGMQLMDRVGPRVGASWIGLCAVLLVLAMLKTYGSQAFALSLIYSAANILFGSYMQAARRAQEARLENESLAEQLQVANKELSALSAQKEQLVLARERSRLARDLHDSVAQTVFSMSLAAQSAGLMLARRAPGVEEQLKRIGSLSQSALSEMKLLISELNPVQATRGGLTASLRRLIAGDSFPKNLRITISTEGDGVLDPREEETLFHIAQEGLNNIVKHARSSEARIRLHLAEPPSLEVEDNGQGFEPEGSSGGAGMGLRNMHEQAAEIGWTMSIFSAPGKGTRIRVEKGLSMGGEHLGEEQ